MKNILERISEISENEKITIGALEKKIGASKGVLSRALQKNTDIQSKWIQLLVENYPQYNAEWLLTGNGKMLKTTEKEAITLLSTKEKLKSEQAIPLYDMQATAGAVTLFDDGFNQNPVDHIVIPNLPKCDGALYVTGDSMYPLLKAGDIIMYKTLPANIDNIFWGEMYLLQLDINEEYMLMVKWIHKSEKGEEYIKLVSENKHHSPKDIHLSQLKGIALVKGSIRINCMI